MQQSPQMKPILFSGPMVNALLDGRKTQTRRVLKPQPVSDDIDNAGDTVTIVDMATGKTIKPQYEIGDLLWVRETWSDVNDHGVPAIAYKADGHVANLMDDSDRFCLADGSFNYDHVLIAKYHFAQWAADLLADEFGPNEGYYWRPSIFMPRAFSRLSLRVTDVRVERLQQISRGDAMAEGCPVTNMADGPSPLYWFHELWDGLNAKRGFGWNANPWVAVYTFEAIRQNVDEVV